MNPKDLPAIESLIPHRAPMRLIDRVLDINGDHIQTVSIVKKTWPLCDRFGADVVLTVEIVAQSAAALHHQRQKRQGEPQIGFLVGIKEACFYIQRLPLHTELKANVKKISAIGNYGIFKGEVILGDDVLCETTIQVLEPGRDLWKAIINGREREASGSE